jgi:hypothetical protein
MRIRWIPRIAALAFVPLILVGVNIADAAPPSAGTLHGCVGRHGNLRVVRLDRGCRAGERSILFNERQSLAGLTDVGVNSPSDGQLLTYDGAQGKWTNSTLDLSQKMSANEGQVLTLNGTMDNGVSGDLLTVPHFAPVHIACSNGVANVTMVLSDQVDRSAWVSVDGALSSYQDGDFSGPPVMTLQGASTPGGHITDFDVERTAPPTPGDWIGQVRVFTGPAHADATTCRVVIDATIVRAS